MATSVESDAVEESPDVPPFEESGVAQVYKDKVPAADRLTALISKLGGGEPREGQVRMVNVFEEALKTGRPAVVQAGTGTGKSFGSLIPAICSGRKTVVVTSSKALQDQLAKKDLPFLQEHLPVSFRFAVMKGRSNYACVSKAAEVRVELQRRRGEADQTALFEPEAFKASDVDDDFDNEDLVDEVERIMEWMEFSPTGDRAELDFEPQSKAWGKVSVGPSECPGAKACSHSDDCFAEEVKRLAGEADVLVVNAHLYGAHAATGGGLLPDHDVLVVDEAHGFEDALVGALSMEISGMRIRQVRRAAKRVIEGSASDLSNMQVAAAAVDDALAATHQQLIAADGGRGSTRLKPGPAHYTRLADALVLAAAAGQSALETLRVITKQASSSTMSNRCERAMRMTTSLVDDLQRAVAADDEIVSWIEESRQTHILKAGTIRIGGMMKSAVWDNGVLGLLCSATLPKGTSSRLGITDAVYVDVGSPFDFKHNALLYVPDLPKPGDKAWAGAAAREIASMMVAAGGRTLALFTSNSMMSRTVEAVRAELPQFTILCQGDAPKVKLVEEFTANPQTCLFATASFWQGIDVPGSTLSLVICDKIPFPVPTDPIVEARHAAAKGEAKSKGQPDKEADWTAFTKVEIPAAATQLAQGVGRLIRTSSDRGVVAVLDSRLATAAYRTQILAVIPPFRRVRDTVTVLDFLAELRDAG